jgi:hypothetical protein
MSSIIKVDQIQLADGSTPTAGDLGLNTTGSVLQVVQGTSNTATSIAANTWVTAVTVNITLQGTNSKLLLNASVPNGASAAEPMHMRFIVDDVSVGVGETSGDRTACNASSCIHSTNRMVQLNGEFLYDTSFASGLTKTCKIEVYGAENITYYLNRPNGDGSNDFYPRTLVTLTVTEIAG